ncbi:hypothetical protein DEO23_14025 [Brachybacterium endophyticum]|uniref:Major tail protein n=1 Tax=Brachybacterium endophyticum TaxID=2182385 RepID=A0A2U2RH66_9MICO|nr:hypothetical protein [Brachybacterium endophyticum]PWH05194.1 hypothetical protein DEO23_14025 [Brachybacterium endophyticum]
MATADTVKLHIAGIGHVFYNDVDADPLDPTTFKFLDESTYGDWIWLGDTSSENLIEFETDGGDTTYKRTWDRLKTGVVREDETISATINSVNASAETFNLGFAGHTYDEASQSYTVDSSGRSTGKALQIVTEDGSNIAGLYLPNTDIKGSFPTFDLEEYMEIPLSVAILSSPGTGALWQWFEPRPYAVAPAA